MKLFSSDTESDLIVIAEIGLNHEGSLKAALNMLEQVAACGAHAVKLQSFTPEKYASSSNIERLERVRKFSLSENDHKELAGFAHKLGIGFCSTPLSEDWVETLASLSGAIKIASGDIDFQPVIASAARTNLPIILSTGCSDALEVDAAVKLISDIRGSEETAKSLALMHCVSQYPANLEDCNLTSIKFMAERYGLVVGWSNHVVGPLACYAAVGMGAKVIEVHVTDKKEGRAFRDHEMSFDFDELRALTRNLGDLRSAMGIVGKRPTKSELLIKEEIRKGLVAARDLKRHTLLVDSDISYARPAHGFKSSEKNLIVGKKLLNDIKSGEIFSPDMF
jgi:N,N'-diacetyllegionaminate synthase